MWQKYSVTIAAIAMFAGGVAQGMLSHRWGTPANVIAAAESLKSVPKTIGTWDGTDFELSEEMLKTAEVTGCLSRRYVNRLDGNTVTLLIFCGPPGPISLHPPTVCFPSAGLALDAAPARCDVDAGTVAAEMWRGDFVKHAEGGPVRLRTYWTWYGSRGHGQRGWQVPANPRVTFAREPYLFKMYVTRAIEGPVPRAEKDVSLDFIRAVITELQSVLPQASA